MTPQEPYCGCVSLALREMIPRSELLPMRAACTSLEQPRASFQGRPARGRTMPLYENTTPVERCCGHASSALQMSMRPCRWPQTRREFTSQGPRLEIFQGRLAKDRKILL